MTTKTKPTTCPYCSKVNDAVTVITKGAKVPEEGSISICIGCREWSIFDVDLQLRKPTPEEVKEVNEVPELWVMLEKAKII